MVKHGAPRALSAKNDKIFYLFTFARFKGQAFF